LVSALSLPRFETNQIRSSEAKDPQAASQQSLSPLPFDFDPAQPAH